MKLQKNLKFKKLRGLQAEYGLDQKDMAKIINVDKMTYGNKINGKAEFKFSEIITIQEYFSKSFEEIFLDKDVANRKENEVAG